ncbi:acyl-CoA synthetase [Streptomyces sp. NPDC007088]|uniref:acyl-CoA synthetase n=1 Tax=Streptomyces sp. NPDC007088 TaxID=3364773 RepID=UPI003692CF89
MPAVLFPALRDAPHEAVPKPALRFGDRGLDYAQLARTAGALARELPPGRRVAVWATPSLETAVAVVAALLAGVAAVPLNPKSGERELAHILGDSDPALVLAAPGETLPGPLAALPRVAVDTDPDAVPETAAGARLPAEPDEETPALVVYTSGTTGPPKGVVLPRRALVATLDALEDAWQWTDRDVLVHALPLFHVHGLILGVLGPLRRGGTLLHLGRFSAEGVRRALEEDGATLMFGVPTMYHRLAREVDADPALAAALAKARLLVSGSAALSVHDQERIAAATGRRVVERYGMSETLMNTSVRADGEARPGTVGLPLAGVGLRLVEDDGTVIEALDGESIGEIQVRGPNLFTEYLNRPDATAGAFDGDWFRTGDMAVREPDGYVRIVGRRATDLIKSGGYKIGAGEIEEVLLEFPGVREAAVTGEPDPDLGERVVAWLVREDAALDEEAVAEHVARRLAPHKRPRVFRYLDALPRNDMGKIMKRALRD